MLYIASLLASLTLGAFASRESNFQELLSPPDFCASSPPARLLSESGDVSGDVSGDAVRAVISRAYALLPLAALNILLGAGWLCLLRHHATALVYCTLATMPLALLSGALTILASPQLGSVGTIAAAALLTLALLYALMLCCCRQLLRLTAALIEQAVQVVVVHLWGLLVAAMVTLAGSGLVCGGLSVSFALLLSNGHFELAAISPDAPDTPDTPLPPPECVWVLRGGWVGGGAALCALLLLWSACLAFTTRFFTVALVTSCWWFDHATDASNQVASDCAPPLSQRGAQPEPAPSALARQRPVRSALGLALSKSFGTLCLAALVISACRLLQMLARMAQRQSQSLILDLILGCVRALLQLVEFLNKFALISHAIGGDPFCASARHTTQLLKSHGLSTYLVDRFSSLVVTVGAISGAALAALLSGTAFEAALRSESALSEEARRAAAAIFASVGACVSFALLLFLGEIVLNVVDACYMCFCLDLDSRRNCRPNVSAVLVQIAKPTSTLLVQQPGDSLPTVIAQPVTVTAQPVTTQPL